MADTPADLGFHDLIQLRRFLRQAETGGADAKRQNEGVEKAIFRQSITP